MKTEDEKQLLIEQLKKTPIVQIACEKTSIGRTSYYRWRKEDEEFSKQADEAIIEGALLINDMAESQLVTAIKDRNMPAITFWLKHHHPTYGTKVEVTGSLRIEKELTPEQKDLVKQALHLAALPDPMQLEEQDDEPE